MAKHEILFAMRDRSGFDHPGRAGHRSLESPAIDGPAARGALRDACCRSRACGVGWMGFHSGKGCGP